MTELFLFLYSLLCHGHTFLYRLNFSLKKKTHHKALIFPQTEMNALLTKPKVDAQEFPASALRLTRSLGDCACGTVYAGELAGYYSDQSIIPVLASALHDDTAVAPGNQFPENAAVNAANKRRDEFYRQLHALADIKHPNILCLLGVKLRDKPLCMIFEQHSEVNLQRFLVTHSPQSEFYENGGHILNQNELLHIVTQVASGMEYLTTRGYVHRDLAARNVLVNNNLVVKISNLGLVQEAYLSDYYRVPNCDSQLPVRWMPIEAILYGKMGHESDIWSYGIVLWEVFSYGLQPYYGYNDQEVIDMIQARHILPCPDECQPFFYALMIECWNEAALRRPTFKQIHTRMIHWKADSIINNTNVNIINYGPLAGPTSQSSGSQHSGPSQRSQPASQPSSHTGPSNNTASTGLTTDPPQVTHSSHYPVHPAYRQPYMTSPYDQGRPGMTSPYGSDQPTSNGGIVSGVASPPGSVASHRSSSVHSSTPSSHSKQRGVGSAPGMGQANSPSSPYPPPPPMQYPPGQPMQYPPMSYANVQPPPLSPAHQQFSRPVHYNI